MQFATHSELAGKHAQLSASKYHWTRYDDEKFDQTYRTQLAAMLGTQLHDFAAEAIKLGIKLPASRKTMNMYVNDAIGYRMTPEQVLCYSYNAFGTADAISFRSNLLRIHDLKTGVSKADMRQLEIYAAYFCLEYNFKPAQIKMELRIYQNDDVETYIPDPMDITEIMDRTVTLDKRIDQLKLEVLG